MSTAFFVQKNDVPVKKIPIKKKIRRANSQHRAIPACKPGFKTYSPDNGRTLRAKTAYKSNPTGSLVGFVVSRRGFGALFQAFTLLSDISDGCLRQALFNYHSSANGPPTPSLWPA